MKTLLALLIMFMALTVGLIAVAIVMAIMGLAGAPGAMLFVAGQKAKNAFLTACGFLVAALGQSYVVGAYSVFVVSLLRWFSADRPEIPTWPLWIAAFLHSAAVPAYGMKERPEKPTAQHHTLGIVALLATAIFFIVAFAPNTLKPVYGWVPFYDDMLQHRSEAAPSRGKPYVVRCEEPLPVFTLGESSNPTKAQEVALCACIWESLGGWEREVSEKLAKGKESEVSQMRLRAFASRFGSALEKCGGMKL